MKINKILSVILAVAMILGTMSISVSAAKAEGDVVRFGGYPGGYIKDLPSAFTEAVNPGQKQVLLVDNWTGDININYPKFSSSFYLNGYTLNGQLKLTELSNLQFYGIEAGNDEAGSKSIITAPNYTIYQASKSNVNFGINIEVTATDADGIAIYAESGKINMFADGVVVNGNIKSTGDAIIKIGAGTYYGNIEADTPTNLEITGGTFAADPTSFLPAGYTAVQGADGMYTIEKPAISIDYFSGKADAEGRYVISTPEDVVNFRMLLGKEGISKDNSFILGNDIDMAGYTLPAAGNESCRFYGTFDGKNHKISNVEIQGGNSTYVAFFGNVTNATIKNLILENVTVNGGEYTASIVGRSRSSVIENCKVIGNINISGGSCTGGLVGGGVINVTNCAVTGNENSSITGSTDVGGLIGLVSEGTTVVSDNTISGIDVNSEDGIVGGLIGRAITGSAGLDVSGNALSNVDIAITGTAPSYPNNYGLAVGATQATNGAPTYLNNDIENSTLTVMGETKTTVYNTTNFDGTDQSENIVVPVAEFNGTEYPSLKEALDAAVATNDAIVYLIGTVEEGSIKLPNNVENLTIDGQGTAVVKNTVINASDGTSVSYNGFTVKNTTFDNSRFVLTGERDGEVVYKNLVFDNNKFINIVAAGNMTAVHMNIASDEAVENFTFINNTIDGVTGSNNSGISIKQVTGNVLIDNNKISNVAWNAIQCINAKPEANIVITNNVLASGADEGVLNLLGVASAKLENNTINTKEGQPALAYFTPVAKIGDVTYPSLQAAVDAANEGETVVLINDIIDYVVNPTADSTSNPDNTLLHINSDDVVTLDLNGKTISVTGSEEAKFDTLAIRNNGNLTIVDNSNDKTGKITLAFNGTQENGSSQIHSTILNFGTLTVESGNIENTATTGKAPYGIYNYSWGGNAILTINGGTVSSDRSVAVFTSAYDDLKKNICNVTINGGVFDGGVWYDNTGVHAADGANVTITGGEFIGTDYAALTIDDTNVNGTKIAVSGGKFMASAGDAIVYSHSTDDAFNGFITGGTFSSDPSAYLAAGYSVEDTTNYEVVADADKTSSIEVGFEATDDERVYNIVLKGVEGDINDFESAHFVFNNANKAIDYTIAPNTDANITIVDDITNPDKISFYMNADKNKPIEITDNEIVLGTVSFGGFGQIDFSIKNEDAKVNATTITDNVVETFVPGENAIHMLLINWTTPAVDEVGYTPSIKAELVEDSRELIVNLAFNNDITAGNDVCYNDIKVTVTGTNGYSKTAKLGLECAEEEADVYADVNTDGTLATFTFGGDIELPVTYRYTVKVEGAGYRTAEYTFVMDSGTDAAAELTFWNNVKDEFNKTEIESGSDRWYTKNFLAGEIVQDNKINKYDLAAVVSYFGEDDLVANRPEYNKYDLNRDGVIDSEDIAYVLVSFGE